jgi:hypothetical protein
MGATRREKSLMPEDANKVHVIRSPSSGAHLEVYRDDSLVFEHSPSALIIESFCDATVHRHDRTLEVGAGQVSIEGLIRANIEAALDRERAQELHRVLGELLAEWPE